MFFFSSIFVSVFAFFSFFYAWWLDIFGLNILFTLVCIPNCQVCVQTVSIWQSFTAAQRWRLRNLSGVSFTFGSNPGKTLATWMLSKLAFRASQKTERLVKTCHLSIATWQMYEQHAELLLMAGNMKSICVCTISYKYNLLVKKPDYAKKMYLLGFVVTSLLSLIVKGKRTRRAIFEAVWIT